MNRLPTHLLSRISALGTLSRPLGEERAAALARAIADSVVADVNKGADPELLLDVWITRIAREIAELSAPEPTRKPAARRGIRSLADFLPEVR
jgi:hypothetical protein